MVALVLPTEMPLFCCKTSLYVFTNFFGTAFYVLKRPGKGLDLG